METTLKRRLEKDILSFSKMMRLLLISEPFIKIVDSFMRARISYKKFEVLYAKNRRILGKNFYIRNSKNRVLRSYKVLETLYLEEKDIMVVKYRERIFLKNGVIHERTAKKFQDIKILEHKLGRAL